jgi:eukaryotic-like serine/threonine-protein kinase
MMDGDSEGSDGRDRANQLLKGSAPPRFHDDAEWFGEYRLLKKLGQGGMGVVYEAVAEHMQPHVALKCMLDPDGATEAEERQFLHEAEAQYQLKPHPNIVRVCHVGKREGRPFFTMDLLGGKSLAARLEGLRQREPRLQQLRANLELLAKVADGVQHAHEHALLHRDLKPANILFDERGEPRIADFGLAKRLDLDASETDPFALAGTVPYMAPEQAGGRQLQYTADVYSLGAIMYELMTGLTPFHDTPLLERRQQIAGRQPVPAPRELEPDLPEDAERVCMKCLEKEPARRYPTALALRDDLRALVGRRAISLPPPTHVGRVRHWLRRHPHRTRRIAVSILAVATLLSVAGYAWLSALRSERVAQGTNAFIATAQAGAALFQLREYADHLEAAAADPLVVSAVARDTTGLVEPPPALVALSGEFDAAFVMTATGTVRCRWPVSALRVFDRSYVFRDYFKGAAQLGARGKRGVYVARAFRSERNNQMEFALSAALFDADRWVGVLVGIIPADAAFGRVRMQAQPEAGHLTALIGPRDIERSDLEREEMSQGKRRERFVFLSHEGLRRGEEIDVPDLAVLRGPLRRAALSGQQFSLPATMPLTESDYHDPVREPATAWNAAFAPVGGTGYVMVAQSRRPSLLDASVAPQRIERSAPLALLALASVAGSAALLRRRRQPGLAE